MSWVATALRRLRYGPPLVGGLGLVLAIGLAPSEARAGDTVGGLLADPARLAAVQQGCKTNQPWATDALCGTAAQAIRLRFRGGGVPYTPKQVDPFPSKPALPTKLQAKRPTAKAAAARPSGRPL